MGWTWLPREVARGLPSPLQLPAASRSQSTSNGLHSPFKPQGLCTSLPMSLCNSQHMCPLLREASPYLLAWAQASWHAAPCGGPPRLLRVLLTEAPVVGGNSKGLC